MPRPDGVFVGYRWFEKKVIEPVFPFGYGLSYTTFKVQSVKVSSGEFTPGKPLTVAVDVTNTGKVAGAEVVQLYVHDKKSSVERPYRELKGFAKVMLQHCFTVMHSTSFNVIMKLQNLFSQSKFTTRYRRYE